MFTVTKSYKKNSNHCHVNVIHMHITAFCIHFSIIACCPYLTCSSVCNYSHILCVLVTRCFVPICINPYVTNVIYIYIYGAPIFDVSRSYTMTQHSR